MLDFNIILSCYLNLKAIIDNIKLAYITFSLHCLSHQYVQNKEIKKFYLSNNINYFYLPSKIILLVYKKIKLLAISGITDDLKLSTDSIFY